ncbi:20S proteasome subunit beta 4 [Malassezia restricta]|uniref:Proteasome subunit beta n=1 Tax=Malassezia restricta (strain ATCC 96810 / NBRC 103918 / CBS 7877) TaxID=425264 RepID=A0A3G2S4Z6_MALR7|nr:20S proteasome subunit beta 4 [Malassezia restricta]AXA50904.1 20S proteasome subunit beta 4 [Malassezia restricta]AYO43173.1 putative proteasome subunit beta type-4 [Malassezia restricta CBS 7877]
MESLFGITGKGFTIIASDNNAARSIIKMKSDDDKQKVLSNHLVMTYAGESGDTIQFAEYIERNMRLYSIRNNIDLRPKAAASWIRSQLAESIRSRHPYQVNLLLGGYDEPSSEPALYWIDYLGTLVQVPFAAHGYASYLTLSTMDRYHRPDMSLEEGLQLLKQCINEMRTRFVIDVGSFSVRIITREGVREVAI